MVRAHFVLNSKSEEQKRIGSVGIHSLYLSEKDNRLSKRRWDLLGQSVVRQFCVNAHPAAFGHVGCASVPGVRNRISASQRSPELRFCFSRHRWLLRVLG